MRHAQHSRAGALLALLVSIGIALCILFLAPREVRAGDSSVNVVSGDVVSPRT